MKRFYNQEQVKKLKKQRNASNNSKSSLLSQSSIDLRNYDGLKEASTDQLASAFDDVIQQSQDEILKSNLSLIKEALFNKMT